MLKYSIITVIISNILMYPFIPFFRTPNSIRVSLRESMHQGQQMKLLKSWGDMRQQNNVKTFIGIIILFVLILLSFYFTFGYCAMYSGGQKSFLMGWVIAVLIDAVFFELAIEFLIACMYYFRNSLCCE
jgi:hypothetical protein